MADKGAKRRVHVEFQLRIDTGLSPVPMRAEPATRTVVYSRVMQHAGLRRLGWTALGAGIALVLVWTWPNPPAPEPSEREERIARDLRIAKEVERDHTKLRLREATERRELWEAQVRHRREALQEEPVVAKPSPMEAEELPLLGRKTMRPTKLYEVVGDWTDDTNTIRLRLFSSGVYRYGGWRGEFLEDTRGGRVTPGYAQPHSGTWTWKAGVLRLEPDNPMRGTQITFRWVSREAALRVRFLGAAPSHINTMLLRKLLE